MRTEETKGRQEETIKSNYEWCVFRCFVDVFCFGFIFFFNLLSWLARFNEDDKM